ncbi:MAG: 2-oxoacid:ferredoxin oxidoreductase subunit beta [Planctomycetota bacterium]|nr:MAG: 2-oxoacid:ferredoxin oxidoreductase subunit beta [Planctomycetota bacterium]
MSENRSTPTLKRSDFVSDQEVRWCPGCGDYSILAQVQKTLPKLGIPKENFVFISGIGCSSRFPYYMNTYGMHSIHGRAPAIASGVKLANPELSVWVITGDGDGLSIGGNHLLHALRRNIDLNIILFNNRIYGLTKGQYSPTSLFGQKTKSSPYGNLDYPVNPIRFAISSEATFIARSIDSDTKHLASMIEAMAHHKGVSFLEVFQNCVIFNDGAFSSFADKSVRNERVLYLEPGKPLIFGKEKKRGIRFEGLQPKVVEINDEASEKEVAIHDPAGDPAYAYQLSQMEFPQFPVPVGIFRQISRPTYDELLFHQIEEVQKKKGRPAIEELWNQGYTWTVE